MANKNKNNQNRLRFDQKLILNKWLLSLFEVDSFDKLADQLKSPDYEGVDENNISNFFHILTTGRIFDREHISRDMLLQYDENIIKHTNFISAKRSKPIRWKYFQYLSLLFTEIYLDLYFGKPDEMVKALNDFLHEFNRDLNRLDADKLPTYTTEDLNKIAFWNATGSGKTLIMHVNILQYLYYLRKNHLEHELNRIILLTPNEGLSNQHLEELNISGIQTELFSKEGRSIFTGTSVEIIDIHKLRDDSGEKTIAVEAFEGNNLVLVDEGHRGSSGKEMGQWLERRAKLCEYGFSFEYSATFGQAMKAGNKKDLADAYAKCIIFDYSYRYFYRDGFGKDFRILNLADDSEEQKRRLYLTACLLSYYQQLSVFQERQTHYMPYLLERPLWVFVGGSVNAIKTERGRKVSDVVDILLFISDFVENDGGNSTRSIKLLLSGNTGLLDNHSRDIFAGSFEFLVTEKRKPEDVFSDIMKVLFNAPNRGKLHVNLLKGADGELSISIGENDPFGVINVGDAPNLLKLCAQHGELATAEKEFSDSLFSRINGKNSPINILIGSKKFTEGWNSWRVSTMGLMNIGRSEGSEIIQLFGRGVRLKGYNFCLKRSKETRAITGKKPPEFVEIIETLNIFGIRADYMRQFKEYLEDEGIKTEDNTLEFVLPVIKNLGSKKLKTVGVKKGLDFKKDAPRPGLAEDKTILGRQKIVVNWYPKIQALQTSGIRKTIDDDGAQLHEGYLSPQHLAFIDHDELYFKLQEFKAERAWHNLNLPKKAVSDLLHDNSWYTLFIPKHELEFYSFEQVCIWQDIALALLKKYCDRYYKLKKQEWEKDHLEVRELTSDDPNFFDEYRIYIEESQKEIAAKIKELNDALVTGVLKDIEWGNFHGLFFGRHLYSPLIYASGSTIVVKPVALNEGEKQLVMDLRDYHETNSVFFSKREMYLLRNRSRGKGIGFFEAGNFHPDFIIWLVEEDRQTVAFIDPHGMRFSEGRNDPKVQFYKEIKKIEASLNDPNIRMESFIVSTTDYSDIDFLRISKEEYERCHVVFQNDPEYLGKVFGEMIGSVGRLKRI